MTNAFPEYTFGSLSGSYADQLGQFEDILDEAAKRGIINNPPNSETETYDLNSQRIRIQTIASRLWLLGYLPHKISPGRIHKKLDDIKSAVATFQKDANLKQDNWVGDITWSALDELVSFESDLTYEKWFSNDAIKPEVINAFHRATQLRLWSLGLFRNKPGKNFKLLEKDDLKNFESILKIFLIKPEHFEIDLNYDLLTILFDQDKLTDSIVKTSSVSRESFMLRIKGKNKLQQKGLAERFIVNCAKIELWLLGYEVDIDGKNDFHLTKGSDLYRAISHYYQHFENLNVPEADKIAEKITPKLFEGIGAANSISDDEVTDNASEEIAEVLKTDADINEAWSYLKNKGTRLWDGMKRIWRWIKKIGKKVVRFLKKNVFKAFFQYASESFRIVGKGISEVVKSLKIYLDGSLTAHELCYRFSKDMDITTHFSKKVTDDNCMRGIDRIVRQSQAFNIGCKIIGGLVYVFKNIATAFFGWAKLLFSLLKGFGELKKLYLDFRELAVE